MREQPPPSLVYLFAILDLFQDGSIRVEGFRKQKAYVFKPPA